MLVWFTPGLQALYQGAVQGQEPSVKAVDCSRLLGLVWTLWAVISVALLQYHCLCCLFHIENVK